jgi:hyaluronan synthase|tara:strand:+ start:1212 stop:2558 length:1347 start_codon:yes stop_codon:yes gene_type:complete
MNATNTKMQIRDTPNKPVHSVTSNDNMPYEIAFWMCFVAFILLAVYVKITEALELHWIFVIYSVAVASLIVSRYVFFMLEKPTLLPKNQYFPTLHAIIPCLNESKRVYTTVKSIFKSNYPVDKIKVTVVDDGSTDDSAIWLSKANKEFGCEIISLKTNLGKRKAIQTAMKNNKSEISVLIDSDVKLYKNGLKEIVRGFSNEKIATVCGNTGVSNANANLLTRMQELYYYLSYGLFRSAESYFKTVVCCTGSFSAYRTDVLKEVATDSWVNQKFLGRTRTFGDDRSLTRLVLSKGYDTVYQPHANASTVVPDTLVSFINQQSRWRRGYLFEAIMASTHMWKRPFGAVVLFYLSLLLVLMGPIVLIYCLVLSTLLVGTMPTGYVTAILAISILHQVFFSIFKEANVLKIGALTLMPAIPFWVFTTIILIPLAIITIKQNNWISRKSSEIN